MFCNNCGNRLAPRASFCPACGKNMVQTRTQSEPRAEKAMYVFRAMRKHSAFKQETAFLVFFKDQLAVAHVSNQQQKQVTGQLRQELKDEGVGYFKSVVATMGYWSQYGERFNQMSLPAILAESPANLAVPYQQITRFYFRGWSEHYNSDDGSTSTSKGKIQIQLAGGSKIKFTHGAEANKQLKEFLTSLFGKRLKYRR